MQGGAVGAGRCPCTDAVMMEKGREEEERELSEGVDEGEEIEKGQEEGEEGRE